MERESIGIKGVDKMVQGGLPKGSVIGLSGPPGVGKSIFTLHFLLAGARKGQKCVYVNLEEPLTNIENMIKQFDFAEEFLQFVKKGKIVIRCFTYDEYEKVHDDLLEKINEDKTIKRLVIDSFNCFFTTVDGSENHALGDSLVRSMINKTFASFRSKEITALLVLEANQNAEQTLHYNIPYLVDGIINLAFLELGTLERRMFIPKMRWTSQSKEGREFDIGKKGIIVKGES